METGNAVIGSLLMGGGLLLIYGSIKNRALFGEKGLVTMAIQRGELIPAGESRAIMGSLGGSVGGAVGEVLSDVDASGRAGTDIAKVALAVPALEAANRVRINDPALGAAMVDYIELLNGQSPQSDVSQAYRVADAVEDIGYRAEANTFRTFIKTVTGR